MKKPVAALLLFVYLFNIGGQLAVHQYFAYLSDRFFNEQTSKGLYNVNDLTEVKIPVNMPGITDWHNYVNVTGQVQFGDASYNYVKMKMTRTALYLMCVPNYKTTSLSGDNIINAKQAKNIPVPKKDHVPYGKTTVSGKFNVSFTQFAFSSYVKMLPAILILPAQQLVCRCITIPHQPPKFSC